MHPHDNSNADCADIFAMFLRRSALCGSPKCRHSRQEVIRYLIMMPFIVPDRREGGKSMQAELLSRFAEFGIIVGPENPRGIRIGSEQLLI